MRVPNSIGVCLAIGSGILIGSSFVFKKKGLLSSQKGHVAGEGVAYLKSASRFASPSRVIASHRSLADVVDGHDHYDSRRALQLRCVRIC